MRVVSLGVSCSKAPHQRQCSHVKFDKHDDQDVDTKSYGLGRADRREIIHC
jgi:hypothetical protein